MTHRRPGPAIGATGIGPLNVLVVEDNEDDFLILRHLLRDSHGERYVLEWAETYEEGLEAIQAQRHDLVLLDFRLTGGTGIELLAETRSVPHRAPVILMTGQGDHEIDLQAMQAGATDYLVKDRLDADLLERAIRYAVERQKTAETLRSLLAEAQARAEREALVNRIGQALLATTEPAIFQARALALLGEALSADRCYLAAWDGLRDEIVAHPDYRRSDLPSVAGKYRLSGYIPVIEALFAHGTAVVPDIRTSGFPAAVIATMEGFALRSVLAVPFFDGAGRTSAAFWVGMADGPREWTPEEVSLTETVAALTRAAVEAARVAERERNIAAQLQYALTPPIPPSIHGMALAKYYETALDEARVGGDFYDVFPIEKGRTALVVGDLTGKGLAAAAQVATVRNMLRYALYRSRTIAGAVQSLNALLSEQHLLTDFSTLFVGVYDSATGALRYVNCGQEPALVRRAAGLVEHLAPTGPVLGMFEGAVFEEEAVLLTPGDALAIFTDGLTEVGQSRTEMLGIEGIASLLGPPFTAEESATAEEMAEAVTLRLIAGVDKASRGGLAKDDICILVATIDRRPGVLLSDPIGGSW
jgi:serine phosphatase RsbU (regulator of sigma subunit)/CheY-like chemotaxis protein